MKDQSISIYQAVIPLQGSSQNKALINTPIHTYTTVLSLSP